MIRALAGAGVLLVPGFAAAAQPPGAAFHAEAVRLLSEGESRAAVRSAWEALEESRRFTPEAWAAETPEGRIVLDELTATARATYRRERAAWRVTLGKALAAAGDSPEAAVELRRAAARDPQPEAWRALAELADLPLAERVDALLMAWRAGGSRDASLREELAATGAFPHADSMVAAVERFRLLGPETDRLRIPARVTVDDIPFPELSLAVRGGVYSSARSFGEGRWLVVYQPETGCLRCGEVVDDLLGMVRGRGVDVIVAVEDGDLPLTTRVAELAGAGFFEPEPQAASARARIAGRPIAHVVRRATLPPSLREEAAGTVRLAARSGYLVLRAPLDEEPLRRTLQPVFRLLDDPPFPGGAEPLAPPAGDAGALIDAIGAFESLGHPTEVLEERLAAAVRGVLREARDPHGRAAELLERASRIRKGSLARRRLLGTLAPRVGDRLLAAARAMDPGILRAAPDGMLLVAVASGRIGLQRQYERQDGSVVLLHATMVPGEPVIALEVVAGAAGGVGAYPGGFQFAHGACVSWGPATGPLEARCPASRRHGAVVVRAGQLVDSPLVAKTGIEEPFLWRRVDGESDDEATESLLAGLAAFARSRFEDAAARFASVRPGPGSPVDDAALRYNLATTRAVLGDREGALGLLEGIGDSTFTPLVERLVRELYRQASIRDPRDP